MCGYLKDMGIGNDSGGFFPPAGISSRMFAVAFRNHRPIDLTLNPSPEGEGLSSIPDGMVVLFMVGCKPNHGALRVHSHCVLMQPHFSS